MWYAGAGFILWAGLPAMWSGRLLAVAHVLSLAVAFFVGWFVTKPRVVWIGFLSLLVANLALALATGTWGLAGNPNYFGCALALGMAAIVGYQLWYFLPFVLGGLYYCQSRAGLFAAGFVCLIGLWNSYRATALMALPIAGLMVVGKGSESMWQRMGIWQDTLNHLTFFGNGYGTFLGAYERFAFKTNVTLALAPHAYNDFLELTFELGVGAILLWVFILLCFEHLSRAERLICLTFFVLGLTYFPFYIIGQVLAFSLGTIGAKYGAMETYRPALS